MDNKSIARTLKLLHQLMELQNENAFKIKSITNAAFTVDKLPFPLCSKSLAEIESVQGIGKSIAAKIKEICDTGKLQELDDLLFQIPAGIVEMLQIKGLGPKKIAVIWKDLEIETVGELYYACNENRLIEAKGFGWKTQQEISEKIAFSMAANGKFIYPKALAIAKNLQQELAKVLQPFDNHIQIEFAGELRRAFEIIESLTFVIGTSALNIVDEQLTNFASIALTKEENVFKGTSEDGLNINIFVVNTKAFIYNLFIHTGSETHTAAITSLLNGTDFENETAIYAAAGMNYIVPELREGLDEIKLATNHSLPNLIELKDLRGTLHNHSNWSDGIHKLEEMALFCRDTLKLEYLGISDHSKSAFYARGLKAEQVLAQHAEIDALNAKIAPFKIFKGIESDILNDGSLDYEEDILKTFDFIVASVHTNLKMTEDKATERIIKAIENPYTTILGHPTGRLLLSRSGYPINYKKVIDACAANAVVIEINSNPLRLDLDWRWHRYALEKGVILSINPDAHRNEGFYDMQYGILAGRKGGLSAEKCLNAWDLEKITDFFIAKKK